MPARRSFASPVRWFIAIAICISVLILGVAWAGTPVPVVDNPRALEQYPAASQGYLAWARVTNHDANSFVKPDGAPKIQMNRPGTASGGVGMDGTTAVYEVFGNAGRGNGNLRMFDVLTETRSDPPAGVNTPIDEYRPSISGDWLMFNRDGVRRNKVILFNISTSERRVLANLFGGDHYLLSNQVNGDWATYESCDLRRGVYSNCQVSLYQISTDTLTQIPNPNRQQYSSSVTSDGTVYFVRGRNRERWMCGRGAQVVRLPNGGTEDVIATIPQGKDVFSTFALEESDTSTTLLLGRQPCAQRRIPRGGSSRYRTPTRRRDLDRPRRTTDPSPSAVACQPRR